MLQVRERPRNPYEFTDLFRSERPGSGFETDLEVDTRTSRIPAISTDLFSTGTNSLARMALAVAVRSELVRASVATQSLIVNV